MPTANDFTRSAIAALLLPLVLLACGNAPPQDEGASADADAAMASASSGEPQIVEVTGADFIFEAPLEVASGWTTFRFTSEGNESHNMNVVRLNEGYGAHDLLEALSSDLDVVLEEVREVGTFVGGGSPAEQGETSEVVLNLEPGNYAIICMVPSPGDGVPHAFKGMVRELTVTEEPSGAPEPRHDLEMSLTDFAIDFPERIEAGNHNVLVSNDAAVEPHEVILARVAPESEGEPENTIGWIDPGDGPPPVELRGGMAALDVGESAIMATGDLEPGEYALICPLQKGPADTAHHMRGMVHRFTVE